MKFTLNLECDNYQDIARKHTASQNTSALIVAVIQSDVMLQKQVH